MVFYIKLAVCDRIANHIKHLETCLGHLGLSGPRLASWKHPGNHLRGTWGESGRPLEDIWERLGLSGPKGLLGGKCTKYIVMRSVESETTSHFA